MSFLFNRRKSPSELCKSVRKHLDILKNIALTHTNGNGNGDAGGNTPVAAVAAASAISSVASPTNLQSSKDKDKHKDDDSDDENVHATIDKSLKKIDKYLHDMKVTILGEPDSDSASVNDEDSSKLTDELLSTDLLQGLIELAVVGQLNFESRKEASNIATYIFHHKPEQSAAFLSRHDGLRLFLERYYSSDSPSLGLPDIVLECGALLREALHHKAVAQLMIEQDGFINKLFELIQEKQFDISSDAWQTFRLILTEHKEVAARYLLSNFDDFVTKFTELLQSENFVTKRQSLKLLSDLLVSRPNYEFMMKYTASTRCLRDIMMLCRTKSLCVQLEAFNVLKLFIANPKKSEGVIEILSRNKPPLIAFLERIAEGVTDEEEKNGNRHDEAFILIAELKKLPDQPPSSSSCPGPLLSPTASIAAHHSAATSSMTFPSNVMSAPVPVSAASSSSSS